MNARRLTSLMMFLFVAPAVGLAQPLPGWVAGRLPVVDEKPDLTVRPWTARGREANGMAITRYHVWISSDGDFNNVASWANNIVPVLLSDCALFEGTSQHDVTTNLARGAAAFQVRTTPEHRGNIGSPGNYLAWTPDAGAASHIRGSGSCYFQFPNPSSARIVVDSKNPTNALTLDGTIIRLFVKRGRVNVTSTASFGGYLYCVGRGAHVVIDAAAGAETAADTNHIRDGVVENKRADDAGVLYYVSGNGHLRQTELWHAATTVYQSGGMIDYWPTTQTAKITLVLCFDGRFDLSQNQIAVLTSGVYLAGENATILGSPAEDGGVTVSWDMRLDYP